MYTAGANNPSRISPDGWHLDHAIIDKPNIQALNLELLYDYPNNLPAVSAMAKIPARDTATDAHRVGKE